MEEIERVKEAFANVWKNANTPKEELIEKEFERKMNWVKDTFQSEIFGNFKVVDIKVVNNEEINLKLQKNDIFITIPVLKSAILAIKDEDLLNAMALSVCKAKWSKEE